MSPKSIVTFGLCGVFGLLLGCSLPSSLRVPMGDLVKSRDLSQAAASDIEHADWVAAEEKLAKAVKVNDKDSDIKSKYAEVLWRRGKKQEAIEQLLSAVKISPNDAKLYLLLAEQCYAIDDFDAASDCANNAIRKVTSENRHIIHKAWFILARVHWQQGELTEALADYHKALSLDPKNPEILMELASLYEAMNKPDRALTAWQGVARLYPPDQEPEQVVLGRGNAYLALSRHQEAMEQFMIAKNRWPHDVQVYCRLAQAKLMIGDMTGAQAFADQAVALSPRDQNCLALKNNIELAQRQKAPLR